VAGTVDGGGAGFLWHCDMPESSLKDIATKLVADGVDLRKMRIQVHSNVAGWFFPAWWPTKASIYLQLWRCGFRLPCPKVSSWFPTGRIGLHVNANTGEITPTEVHRHWIDKDEYDPPYEKLMWWEKILKRLGGKKSK
jgi:hypothetical protein